MYKDVIEKPQLRLWAFTILKHRIISIKPRVCFLLFYTEYSSVKAIERAFAERRFFRGLNLIEECLLFVGLTGFLYSSIVLYN